MIVDPPAAMTALPRVTELPDGGHLREGAAPWPCWIEVDLAAVRHNVQALQKQAQPAHGVTAVVKAQAYGLGASAVARAAMDAGARGVAVARVVEGARLRQGGFEGPVLVLGAITPRESDEIVRWRLAATVTDWATAQHLEAAAAKVGARVPVHVKVDTGITRYGAPAPEAIALVRALPTVPHLVLEGFFTHFAAADEPDTFFAAQQLAYFRAVCAQLEGEGFNLGLRHAANSAGSLRLPNVGLDTIRPGIALSGSYATPDVPRTVGLRPAVSLKARVGRLHQPKIGTSIGYGRTYRVQRPMKAALITCGYADGLPRALSNKGHALIRGQRVPLIGTISMDMAMADVTHVPGAAVGDEVVLIGRQVDEEITLDQVCETAGIIPHEALVRLGSRAPRVYTENGTPSFASFLGGEGLLALPEGS